MGRLKVGCAAVATLTVVVACSQPTTPTADPLEGQWEWLDATGGIAGTTITPTSVGYSMTVEYTVVTGLPARFRVLRDDTLFAETTVERRDASDLRSGTLVYRDPVLGWPEQEFDVTAGDTLVLRDGCCDGFTYRFRRGAP